MPRGVVTFVVIAGLGLCLATVGKGVAIDPDHGKPAGSSLLIVAADGRDSNPCTLARPCQSLNRAVSKAQAGAEVWMLQGTYPPQTIGGSASGPVVVRAPIGLTATVAGDVVVERGLVTLDSLTVTGVVEFKPGAKGSALINSRAQGFDIFGADDVLIQGNTLDGAGVQANNIIWDEPAGDPPTGWRIVGNTLQNFFVAADDTEHSEALYVGYATNGLIEGNRFVNNGTTSHVFFTWFGGLADPATSYPRSICVKRNRFGSTHTAFWAISFREEIPSTAAIRIDPSNGAATITAPQFRAKC